MTAKLLELCLMLTSVAALVFLCVIFARAGLRTAGQRRQAASNGGRRDENGTAHGVGEMLARRVARAGLPLQPVAFLLCVVIIPLCVSLFVFQLFDGFVAPAVLAFVVSILLVCVIVREGRKARAWRFEEKLVDAVDLMASAIRGGENPTQALSTTGEACGNPVRFEFNEVARRLTVGMPIRRALGRMVGRYDSESVRLFTNTLAAKWTAGGDMAPVLLSISRMMRERLRHRLRIRAQLAGAWVTAILVAISPYILVFVFSWRFPEWLEGLLLHPLGPGLLFLAVCLQIVGFVWLHRIMRVESW